MSENSKKTFYCNTELALDIIGGKWKPLIIYHLGKSEPLRFGELKRVIPNINERVLTRLLKELVDNKLLHREDFYKNPPHVEYSLTDLGKTLSPIIVQLGHWGKSYNSKFDYGDVAFKEKS